MIDIKDRICQVMDEKGIKTIRELAKRSDLGEEAVRKYVNGISIPNSPALHALAKALGVSMEWLLTGEQIEGGLPYGTLANGSSANCAHELYIVAEGAMVTGDIQKAISLIHGMDKGTREVFLNIGALLTQLREG